MPETPEQVAALVAVEDEVQAARAKLQAAAAANARRVRALDEEKERNDLSDMMERMTSLAERATGLTREQLAAAALALNAAPAEVRPYTAPVNPRRRRMVTAGVPELHVKHIGDMEPEECDALRLVREHFQRPSGGFLVLGGGKGTRRTGSASWMLGQVDGGVFVDARDLIDIAVHDRPMFLRLRRAKYVVLDDLGAEDIGAGNDQAVFQQKLDGLWNGWYGAEAYVIATGNITRAQFDAYGERIKDRMDERGRFFSIGGTSVRAGMRKHWIETSDRGEP